MSKIMENPNENEICEIGAHLRDSGVQISNADVGRMLFEFVSGRNRPEPPMPGQVIRAFMGITLTQKQADKVHDLVTQCTQKERVDED